jgi:D-alanyl-lipoteichoic acid acyltransferase DltB (MBOAT superfamily)
VVLKTEALSTWFSRWWRSLTGQDTSLASPIDLAWLGFSFVAFRLIHTLRDRQVGILPILSLREYLTYVVFFASYTAGPIDRAERFSVDYRAVPEIRGLDPARLGQGGWRIALGFLKKFIIADTMAQGLSLTPANAAQADSIAFLWVLLYGYAVRLYLDFAGYTDIAIGIGILYGIRLPENFDRPYLKSNIAEFWQSWHITLSNWVRFYVFSPLSRWLLTRKWRPSSTVIVLFSQLATMVVIGLWHGITWNFFIWGLWHGFGLFVHKQWSDRTRKWYRRLGQHPWRERAWTVFSWFLTFNFVVLGWVWFALPSLQLSIEVFLGLFGFGT